jgi:hypothetical protein
MKYKSILAVFAAAVMLTQTGCTGSDILLTLEASVAASEILVASLATADKIPATDATLIENAIATVPAAYTQTTTELASSDTPSVKALKIAAYFANSLQALNALPASAQVYAIPVTQAINAFLNAINPPPASARERGLKAAAVAFPATGGWHYEARRRLSGVKTRALTLQIALDNLKK